jgi:hypothetical protein
MKKESQMRLENLRTRLRQEKEKEKKQKQMEELRRINQTWFGTELWYQMMWTCGLNFIEPTIKLKPTQESQESSQEDLDPLKSCFKPRFGENATKGLPFISS